MAKDDLSGKASVNHSGELTFQKLYETPPSYRLPKPTTCMALERHLYFGTRLIQADSSSILALKNILLLTYSYKNGVKHPKSMYIITTRTPITSLT